MMIVDAKRPYSDMEDVLGMWKVMRMIPDFI